MKYQVFITTCLKSQINALNRVLLDIHEEDADYLGDGVFASQASSFMYPKTPFKKLLKNTELVVLLKQFYMNTMIMKKHLNNLKHYLQIALLDCHILIIGIQMSIIKLYINLTKKVNL